MLNIVFGLDDRFAKFCGTAMASILANHRIESDDDKIHFFLLGKISAKNKERLLNLRKIQDFECSFPEFDENQFKDLPTTKSWSMAMYYRLLIPEILNVDKAIYLDGDIIVNADIKQLWDYDISAYSIAGVGHSKDALRHDYFNSGVLVFNLIKMRQEKFPEIWRERLKQISFDSLIMPDQDILNAVLKNKALFLPIQYNVRGENYDYMLEHKMRDKIVIAHYTPGKPLELDCPPYLRKLYFKYCALTYWKENMFDFWLRRFAVNPIFFLKPKYWKKMKEMKEKEKIRE
jgi:lipopolysaccharide biosynthesis glycosyltransferase